jgi:hypothetical protein
VGDNAAANVSYTRKRTRQQCDNNTRDFWRIQLIVCGKQVCPKKAGLQSHLRPAIAVDIGRAQSADFPATLRRPHEFGEPIRQFGFELDF